MKHFVSRIRAHGSLLFLGILLSGTYGLEFALARVVVHDHVLSSPAIILPGAGDVVIGNPEAPVTLLALVSLTCLHCKHWEAREMPFVVANLVDTGRARLVIRSFPLDEQALLAATLVSCLPPQERMRAQRMLMANQMSWVQRGAEATARAAGIEENQIAQASKCSADPIQQNSIKQLVSDAKRLWGIAATPSFVLGRHVVVGEQSSDDLSHLVEQTQREH